MKYILQLSFIAVIVIFSVPKFIDAQTTSRKSYFIQFTDKDNSPYSVNNPHAYLSQRAIDRRLKHNIDFFTEQDLPVNQSYLDSLENAGAKVLFTSKWFNAATIIVDTDTIITNIQKFTFVKKVEKVLKKADNTKLLNGQSLVYSINNYHLNAATFTQISMMKGHKLHEKGFLGANVIIAVIDAGFARVDSLLAFENIRKNNQILMTYDFVDGDSNVYDDHTHGMSVLSSIAGQIPGALIGTAPEVSFLLLRSENGGSEYLIEEDAWVAAAEFADSAGADIINSSLGYSDFDDPSMNHSYDDMDGNTTRVSIGADIAVSKGILVINSAGNEGRSDWKYITAPADGDSVMAIGAVDENGEYAKFSSIGPSSDGDIKPNVVAMGAGTVIASTYDGLTSRAQGTSLSAPLISGLAACLMGAFPTKTNMEIKEAIEKSAHLYANPNFYLGYGIPDFEIAYEILRISVEPDQTGIRILELYPNPFKSEISLSFFSDKAGDLEVFVTDNLGRLVASNNYKIMPRSVEKIRLDLPISLSPGLYFLIITDGKQSIREKIIKI